MPQSGIPTLFLFYCIGIHLLTLFAVGNPTAVLLYRLFRACNFCLWQKPELAHLCATFFERQMTSACLAALRAAREAAMYKAHVCPRKVRTGLRLVYAEG